MIISKDSDNIRMAPEFDNNRALNMSTFEFDKDMHVNGKRDIYSVLEFCLENFSNPNEFLAFIDNCVKNVNVRKAAENIKNEKRIIIPQSDIIDMEMQVHGRATQMMRHWLEEKNYSPTNNEGGNFER